MPGTSRISRRSARRSGKISSARRSDGPKPRSGTTRSVPPVLVQQETVRRLEGLAGELASRGVDPAQAGVDWEKERERHAGLAADDIRAARILDAIAEKESLTADDEEMNRFFEAEARMRRKTAAAVRGEYEKSGRIEGVRRHLARDRVLDFLISSGHILSEGDQP
jgi:FKBP-type peptidyl-prolyl cis-trans isomerase (trigger factor)